MNTRNAKRAYPRSLREGASGRENWHFQAVWGRAVNRMRLLQDGFKWLAGLLLFVGLLCGSFVHANTSTVVPLFDAPQPPVVHDEILVISTRALGTVCNDESTSRGLRCQRLATNTSGQPSWKTSDWRRLLSSPKRKSLPTIIYVHGNRMVPGQDRLQGMQVYRSLKAHTVGPVRFIIWSWPSKQISGPIKDYLVKAQRTNPAAWQLAWLLDKLPGEAQISLVGYSFGTRIVSGATHLLAGGQLGRLKLVERTHPARPPVRAVLLAAAYDADWFQPGRFYDQALGQLERLILATNELDPAMRFYHLGNGRGRMHALGKSGVYQPGTLGAARNRLQRVDFTSEVGRSHSLADYLAADRKMSILWHELTMPRKPAVSAIAADKASGR